MIYKERVGALREDGNSFFILAYCKNAEQESSILKDFITGEKIKEPNVLLFSFFQYLKINKLIKREGKKEREREKKRGSFQDTNPLLKECSF